MELIRSAALLLDKGNVDGARDLLRRAAELGSGPAALELARTYDSTPSTTPPEARETNPALARVWYERARELGMADAAIPPSSGGR
jgi:TPR repeat protein